MRLSPLFIFCWNFKMEKFWERTQQAALASVIVLLALTPSPTEASRDLRTRLSRQGPGLVLCTAAGFIPYPGDTTKYIQCVWISPRWYYYIYNCPPGSGFDPARMLCVFGVTNAPTTPTEGSSDSASSDSGSSEATTAAGGDTTAAGGDTTAAGGDTTAAGGDTTAAGGDTTAAGGDTTAAADDTTAAGGDTTAAGGDTTTT